MKRILFKSFWLVFLASAFYACSKNKTIEPDNPNPGNGNGNGNGTEEIVSYDNSYPLLPGKSSFSVMSPDGKVIIAGTSSSTVAKIFRVDKDGKHDASFSIDQDKSWVINAVEGLALQPDGRVIVAGKFLINGKLYGIIRLSNTGLLDRSYIFRGYSDVSGQEVKYTAIATLADGKIIYSETAVFNGIRLNTLKRLNADGSEDNSFSASAKSVKTWYGDDYIYQIIPLNNGKLLIAGGIAIDEKRFIIRLNPDGKVDLSFNFQEALFFLGKKLGVPNCIAVQQDGKTLVGGFFDKLVDENQRDTEYAYPGLFRLNTDGSIDKSYTANREKITPVEITVRKDNSFIVLSNSTNNPGSPQIALYKDTGDLNIGYTIAEDKSNLKRIFLQSDTQYLVTGDLVHEGKSSAVARLIIK